MNKKSIQKIGYDFLQVGWVMAVFFGVSWVVTLLFQYMPLSQGIIDWIVTPVGMMVLYAFVDALATTVMLLPFYMQKLTWKQMREQLGMSKPFLPKMVPWALFIWGVYYVVMLFVMAIIMQTHLFGIDVNQAQDVGFSSANLDGFVGYVAAFFALVVVAPVFEEIMFRGFLYGRLRRRTGYWASAILTSLAFAVLHAQINVGIDVFILSMFLCYLRERFDSVWPGMIVHGFKNGLAYALLFILPLYGINLV